MSRLGGFGEPLDDDEAQPTPHLWDQDAGSGMALPVRRCILCSGDLLAHNLGEVCADCRLIIANLFREPVEDAQAGPQLNAGGLFVSV
jgi:hypothetical protein